MKQIVEIGKPNDWGICEGLIQDNPVLFINRPSTQEENYGGVVNKWDIYSKPHLMVNGIMYDIQQERGHSFDYLIGRLIQYSDGSYSFFIKRFKLDL